LGVVEYAALARGETLPVTGAGVGGAAAQIGKWRRARLIGVDRYQLPSRSPAARAIDDFILIEDKPRDYAVHRLTKGRGAQVSSTLLAGRASSRH